MRVRRADGGIEVLAWGAGAEAALEAAPDLLGWSDDPDAFRPSHPLLRDLARRLRGLRMGRTGAMFEALVPSILEQKVAGKDAWRSYAAIVRAWGEPAPGPRGLLLPPPAERLAAMPYHAFHGFGIERRRAGAVVAAGRSASRVEAAARLAPEEARRRLQALPGIGAWTAAEVTRTAMGDPDAVSVGDYHVPHIVSFALAGEARGDDARMLELLEPCRGQRARAVRLLEAGGIRAPRFGPRMPLRSIARM